MIRQEKARKPISESLIRDWLKQSKHRRSPWGEKLDENGYAPSLLSVDDEECFICGKGGSLARHELFGGADRQTSKAIGLWGYVCPNCHEKAHKQWEKELHEMGQRIFERTYTHEEFIALIGKNYL